jgi:hypothetical protein
MAAHHLSGISYVQAEHKVDCSRDFMMRKLSAAEMQNVALEHRSAAIVC